MIIVIAFHIRHGSSLRRWLNGRLTDDLLWRGLRYCLHDGHRRTRDRVYYASHGVSRWCLIRPSWAMATVVLVRWPLHVRLWHNARLRDGNRLLHHRSSCW